MPTRRTVVKAGIVSGAAAAIGGPLLLTKTARAATLDPTAIPKYVTPLFVMPAMPSVRTTRDRDVYSVAATRFTQQILPPGFPRSTVFGFGSLTNPNTFHAPSYTLETRTFRETQVSWVNRLVDSSGNYIPPMLTVDPTIHWANPPGGINGRDSTPNFTSTPAPYTGPMPLVVHQHGGHTYQESDGFPEAWYLPDARNIPAGYARGGTFYDQFAAEALDRWGVRWSPGTAVYVYPNDQRAGIDWFHDHSLGMTRTTVYSGLVGMYLMRGGSSDLPPGVLPGPAPQRGDAPGTNYYEIPLVLQDKAFNEDGSLFFPSSRAEFDGYAGPYMPETDIPPYWNPLFLGNTIAVNGNTWPYLEVEPRRYRFRALAAANIRPFTLKVVSDPLAPRPAPAALPIWLIGSDGGFLPAPVSLQSLPIFTSERYDFIVDFTGLTPGTQLYLSNEGAASAPATTGQIMQFRVVPLRSRDTSTPPEQLSLPGFRPVGPESNVRRLSVQQLQSVSQPNLIGQFEVGLVNPDGTPSPRAWHDPITETPALNTTETWEFHNFTPGGHAIHIHLIQFQVVNRQPIAGGAAIPPSPWEVGDKDVVFAPSGQITRVKAFFDRRSMYVWHCHFIDHEDHNMMRPWRVV